MNANKIVLCYRKIIDAQSNGWEKLLHTDTYHESKIQFPLFDPENRYHLFSQLLIHQKNAEKLPFLVSAAARGYIIQLNGIIPDIKNSLGKSCLTFSNYQFEIIESDTRDLNKHIVAVSFYTDTLIWHTTISEYLLISNETRDNTLLTHQIRMQPFLGIYSIEK